MSELKHIGHLKSHIASCDVPFVAQISTVALMACIICREPQAFMVIFFKDVVQKKAWRVSAAYKSGEALYSTL